MAVQQEPRMTTSMQIPAHRAAETAPESVIGRPAQHLMEAASDCSLVVIGRRTRHAELGMHIGPVAHAVIHHCDGPIAVIPHEA